MKKNFLNSQTIFLAVIILVIVYFVFIRPSKFGADELPSTTDLIVPGGLTTLLLPIKDASGNSLGSVSISVPLTVIGFTQSVSVTRIENIIGVGGIVTSKLTYQVGNSAGVTVPIGTSQAALPPLNADRTTTCTSNIDRATKMYVSNKAYADAQCSYAGYGEAIDTPIDCTDGTIKYKCLALSITLVNPYISTSISSITYQLFKADGQPFTNTSTQVPVESASIEIPNFINKGYVKIIVTPKVLNTTTNTYIAGTAVPYNYGASFVQQTSVTANQVSFIGNMISTTNGQPMTGTGIGGPNTLNNNASSQNNTITLPSAKVTVTSASTTGIRVG